MRLAGYSLEDICRTTMTPNERPMLERVDGRNDIYWLEADFCAHRETRRLGQQATSEVLLDHLVRACEQRRRHGEAKRPGGLEVDNQFVLCRSLNRQDGWLLALEDTIDVAGRLLV